MSFLYQLSASSNANKLEPMPQVDSRWVFGVLIAATCYQFVLCFLNTAGFTVSAVLVGLSEVLILSACVPALMRNIPIWLALSISAILINFVLLTLIRGEVDAKGLRDLLLAVVFFWFGWNVYQTEKID